MNNVLTIIGLQWGDEGKGKLVDWLAGRAKHIARFQGGHNAGHSLVYRGKKTVLHLLPSGVLQPQTRCYIGCGVVVSPAALLAEIDDMRRAGVALDGRLFVADSAALILPYHQRIDAARDKKNKIGTTGRGIGPAHEDKVGRRALRFYDFTEADSGGGGGYDGYGSSARARLEENVSFYNYLLARHGERDTLCAAALWDDTRRQVDALRPFLTDDIGARLAAAAQGGERVLLEGAQGALLDIEHGTYPYTTSAACLAAAADAGIGAALSPAVVGITKCYATRVGNGPFPTEMHDDIGKTLAARGEEFGATTGRARRVGWLDIPLLRHTIRLNGCRQLIVTKLDILDALDEIKLCTAYERDGRRLDCPPSDAARLSRCTPLYETLPGWRKTGQRCAGVTDDSRLPPAARAYLARIEELTGVPVAVISTGAERDMTIRRREVF